MKTTTYRRHAPPIKAAIDLELHLSPYEKYTLDNGIPVYVVKSDTQETMLIDLVFPAGSWYESQNLEAATTNALMKNGSSQHTALEINEMVEYYGAYLNSNCYHEHANYTLHCLSKHLPQLLPVLQEIILDPVFPEQELHIYRQNMKQRLVVNLQKCDFVANRHIDKYLFGEFHPYGRTSSLLAYDALQRETLLGFYKKHYAFNLCKIFVAGHLPSDIIPLLNEYFGLAEWNDRSELLRNEFPIQPAKEKKYRIVNDERGVQGAIRVARHMPNRYHPDFPKIQVLNTILGGYFGSRLMRNIREDKGYTYGIHSQLYNFRQTGALNIQTEAGKEVCEATIQEIYHELCSLQEKLVSREELSLVRNYMIGSVLGDLDGAFQIIQRWKSLILNELDEDYFYHQLAVIKTISSQELLQLAQQYLQPADFYELVVI